jgi:hypothetical protein
VKLFLILAALALVWTPARVFWRFAAWEARLRTARDNERGGRKGGGR